jgi:hypothetical protein
MIPLCRLTGFVLALGLAVAALPTPGLAAMSEAEAVKMIEATFDVQVLRVRAQQVGDRPAWLLTVMNRGGDFNTAFQVNTLAVDQESGKLVSAVRHGPSGYELSGADRRDDKVGLRPEAIRSRAWR